MSDLKEVLQTLYEERNALKARITEAIGHIKPTSLRSDSFKELDQLFLKLKKTEELIQHAERQLDRVEKPPNIGGEGTEGRTT